MAYPKKKQSDDSYRILTDDLKAGRAERLYFFHGEEPYLMERSLEQLRRLLIPEGAGAFNHHRFEGRSVTPQLLVDTVDLLPVFSERTLIEVRDYDLFKAPEADRAVLQQLLTDLPEYVCMVFIFDTVPYAPDTRTKMVKAVLACGQAVDFPLQESGRLVRWIVRHAADEGKEISRPDAEYLSFLTGGQMTALNTEIAKLCSYCSGKAITRADIDVCVTPTPCPSSPTSCSCRCRCISSWPRSAARSATSCTPAWRWTRERAPRGSNPNSTSPGAFRPPEPWSPPAA